VVIKIFKIRQGFRKALLTLTALTAESAKKKIIPSPPLLIKEKGAEKEAVV